MMTSDDQLHGYLFERYEQSFAKAPGYFSFNQFVSDHKHKNKTTENVKSTDQPTRTEWA